jgi:hypothetical protein
MMIDDESIDNADIAEGKERSDEAILYSDIMVYIRCVL